MNFHLATAETRKPTFYDLCAWCVISVSLICQVARYVQNRGLRYDECRMALNLVERDFLGLTRPLSYEQAAPIGFLWIEKLLILAAGDHEYVLRLFPLLAGLATPIVLWLAVRQAEGPRFAAITTFLLSFNFHILLYSGELKQYAVDVAVSALLLALCLWALRSNLTSQRMIAISLACAAALWISHPAVFVIGGVWTAVAGKALFSRSSPEAGACLSRHVAIESLAIGTCIIGASFLTNYRIAIAPVLAQGWTTSWWHDSFSPFPPTRAEHLAWYLLAFADMLLSERAGGLLGLCLAGPYFTGLFSLVRTRPWLAAALAIPSLLALIASALGRFGFSDRQILFLQPFVVFLVAEGIDVLFSARLNRNPRLRVVALFAAMACCVVVPVIRLSRGELNHWNRLETRPVLETLSVRLAPHDVIYVTQSLSYPFFFYSRFYSSLDGMRLVNWTDLFAPTLEGRIAHEGNDPTGYEQELDEALVKSPNARRVWVLSAQKTWIDGGDVRSSIRTALEKRGDVEQFDADGVTAFLVTMTEDSMENM